MKFDFFTKYAGLVIFTEKIRNGKLLFLRNAFSQSCALEKSFP